MKLKITLKRSFIGRSGQVRKIILSLGLKRLHQSVVHDDTPPIRGMIHKISTLVEVAGIKDQEPRKLKGAESKK